jgi:CDP-diacylglycerol pyrophosphatase
MLAEKHVDPTDFQSEAGGAPHCNCNRNFAGCNAAVIRRQPIASGRSMRPEKSFAGVMAAAILALAGIGAWYYATRNPNALWRIVSERCVPEAQSGAGKNACAKVDLNSGYVILKDRNGIAQHLLIPTRRIEGIESPDLVAVGAHNYWRDAWNERDCVEQAIRSQLEPGDIGLAVNSAGGRSQNQLHIHIDCMRPDVLATLGTMSNAITAQWGDLPTLLSRHHYRARLITDPTLSDADPFQMLYSDLHERGESMADQSLLLTATTLADGKPGFILLNGRVRPGDDASAEELLDHSCSLAKGHQAG